MADMRYPVVSFAVFVIAVVLGTFVTYVSAADPVFPVPNLLHTNYNAANVVTVGCPYQGELSLSWGYTWTAQGEDNLVQNAYQVSICQTTEDCKANKYVWTSSKVEGKAQSILAAVSLKPASSYVWQVCTWFGSASASCSAPLGFETEVVPASWYQNVTWIGGKNQIRTNITLPGDSKVTRARAYASGLGAFYLFVNGQRVGNEIMSPPQTVYPKRVLYSTLDITALIQDGGKRNHVIGAMLGNVKWGYTDVWCNMTAAGGPDGCRAFIAQIRVDFEDGTTAAYGTNGDGSWVCRQGPVVWDHLFHGETYDANLEMEGWSEYALSSFAEGEWEPARAITPPGTGTGPLAPMMMPPIRIDRTYDPVTVDQVGTNSYVYDFGQNMAGIFSFSLPESTPAGLHIAISFAEMRFNANGGVQNGYCHPNPAATDIRLEPCKPHQTYGTGHFIKDRYIGDFNCANATTLYITKGGSATFQNLFTYEGFRFAQITGLSHAVPAQAHFTHTDVASVGNLKVAEIPAIGTGTPDVLNRIHAITRAAQLSQLWSIPTDCPQRERRGWTGDAQLSSGEACHNFDMQAFYRNFLTDIRNDQLWGCANTPGPRKCTPSQAAAAVGSIADVVPYDGIGGWPGCPIWQVAYIVIAHNVYRHYNDKDVLVQHYAGLKDLTNYFERHVNPATGLLETSCYGDWIDVDRGSTPPNTVTAFYYLQALESMSRIASIVGQTADANHYANLYETGKGNYHKNFFDSKAGGYGPTTLAPAGSQTSNSMGILLDPPADMMKSASDMLRTDIMNRGNHSSGGIVGMAVTYPALAKIGADDLAMEMLLTDEYPSFGYMVKNEQTTLCESWNCTAYQPIGSSHNHIMYGAFDEWVVNAIGGLTSVCNTTTAGWQEFLFSPTPAALTYVGSAQYSLTTRFGPVGAIWKFIDGSLHFNITVAIGTAAQVKPPTQLHNSLQLTQILDVQKGEVAWKSGDGDLVKGSGVHQFVAYYE